MNFFKFIQNEDIPNDIINTEKTTSKTLSKVNNAKQSPQINSKIITKVESNIKQKESKTTLDIKMGMMVRIIYLEGSIYNSYKGYIGEIKSFVKNKNHVNIHLHACPSFKIISVPIEHFQIMH